MQMTRRNLLALVAMMLTTLATLHAAVRAAQPPGVNLKPRIKLGAYYFAGWSGKSPYDDGAAGATPGPKGCPPISQRSWPRSSPGRTPVWGWREDSPEITARQIDLAADHGIAFFAYCWYFKDRRRAFERRKDRAKSAPRADEDVHGGEKQHAHGVLPAGGQYPQQGRGLSARRRGNKRRIIGSKTTSDIPGICGWMANRSSCSSFAARSRKGRIGLSAGSSQEGRIPGRIGCGLQRRQTRGWNRSSRTFYNVKPNNGTWKGNSEEIYHLPGIACGSQRQVMAFGTAPAFPTCPIFPVVTQGWDRRPWEAKNGEGLGKGAPVSWSFHGRNARGL